MAESITQDFSQIGLGKEEPADGKMPIPRAELEVTIQELVARGNHLNDEVETYIAAVLEKQKVGKVYNPVEFSAFPERTSYDPGGVRGGFAFTLTVYSIAYASRGGSSEKGYRNLRNDMHNELAFLQKIAGSTIDEEKARHYIVSSNLLYYEALWGAAKRSMGIQSFRKYFFWDRHKAPAGKSTTKGVSLAKGSQAKNKTSALVDIVAEEGAEWIRVSTVSEKRILFDLAKLGWVNDSDSDDEDMPPPPEDDDDDEEQIDVVRNARGLARAARANPIRGRPPKVRFVLTRISAGKTPAIDMIINKIRATGAIVQCGEDIPPALSIDAVLPRLLIDRSRALSDTLNIDCTILLALISDISHKPCPILDWYPKEVRAQIEEEAQEHLLPTHLYPAIGAHPMVCTREAVEQMNLIVQTLATDTEKTRADLLLRQGGCESWSPKELVDAWAALSDYEVPSNFALPITVKTPNVSTITDNLPSVATAVAAELGHLNKSIFLYGWSESLTTLSANRGRAKQIEHIINDHGLKDGEAGPHIWLCGESRSLIAKHGRRK
ncbi:hypothetical protein BKA58DRAFT_400382 [Alternaria rosae]|uniref:uncharacterized protein n=1 Tax=Alternaria rosae TaxID=1187941 RepID=UPI001E8E85DF|nr:uncharacterized protein BKA58DRAFT_400382 [Alternaria rosae]KAH6876281.1 hypothetical protein BKA58DRAFT_400382 [Alternaria rosae]